MKLFIGCSSSNDIPQKYIDDCKIYLEELLIGNDIVFGACSDGLMGISYNIAKKNNKKITGICPVSFKEDLQKLECDYEELTETISQRTTSVIDASDALIFLPGGIGTIYELFTAIESKRSHEFDKPIVIYNSCNYFDKLFSFLELIYSESFTSDRVKKCYHISNTAEDTLNYINNYNSELKLRK